MKSIFTFLLIVCFTNVFAQADTVVSKTIVDPTAMVAGSFGGNIQAAKFKAARKIELAGASADSAIVISYMFYASGKGFESGPQYIQVVKGNLFTKEVIEIVEKAKPGTTIVIDEIKVAYRNRNKWIPSATFTLY
jgi:hypothetical protein